jgi:hypothetical protein
MLDAYESVFEYRGLTCAVWFGKNGVRIGNVLIPTGHPWHGIDGNKTMIDCHGGCWCAGELGMLKGWFVWFDCGHLHDRPDLDAMPEGLEKEFAREHSDPCGTLWTCAMVERECRRVADQVIAAATPAADPLDLAGFVKRALSGPTTDSDPRD